MARDRRKLCRWEFRKAKKANNKAIYKVRKHNKIDKIGTIYNKELSVSTGKGRYNSSL